MFACFILSACCTFATGTWSHGIHHPLAVVWPSYFLQHTVAHPLRTDWFLQVFGQLYDVRADLHQVCARDIQVHHWRGKINRPCTALNSVI